VDELADVKPFILAKSQTLIEGAGKLHGSLLRSRKAYEVRRKAVLVILLLWEFRPC
jgi:hypothetical protein